MVSMDVGLSEVIGQIPLLSVAWRGVAEHSVCNFVSEYLCAILCVCLLVCCFLYLLCFLVGWYSPEGAVVIVVAVVRNSDCGTTNTTDPIPYPIRTHHDSHRHRRVTKNVVLPLAVRCCYYDDHVLVVAMDVAGCWAYS